MITHSDRIRAKVAGLASRAHAGWLAVTVDGKWITAAGTAGPQTLIWRSRDDLLEILSQAAGIAPSVPTRRVWMGP